LLSKLLPGQTRLPGEYFSALLTSLQKDLERIAALQELLIEKIAREYWRLGVAAWYESQALTNQLFVGSDITSGMDKGLRYQSTINRQLYQAINQLERLQRLRKGDNVPARLNVQVLHGGATLPDKDGPMALVQIFRNEAKKIPFQIFEAIESQRSEVWLEGIGKELRNERYKPQPVRRAWRGEGIMESEPAPGLNNRSPSRLRSPQS
jgi:hypothetical protein